MKIGDLLIKISCSYSVKYSLSKAKVDPVMSAHFTHGVASSISLSSKTIIRQIYNEEIFLMRI